MSSQQPTDVPPIGDWNRLLDGRVAVVTGGGDGIGGAISSLFAQHGALVEIADVDPDRRGQEHGADQRATVGDGPRAGWDSTHAQRVDNTAQLHADGSHQCPQSGARIPNAICADFCTRPTRGPIGRSGGKAAVSRAGTKSSP